MDVKIENEDISVDSAGSFVMIDGFDEIVQQALIRMKIPKGKFIYDRNLGSFCDSLDINTGKNQMKALEMLINESLVSLNNAYVKVNSTEKTSKGIKAEITVFIGDLSTTKEVIF